MQQARILQVPFLVFVLSISAVGQPEASERDTMLTRRSEPPSLYVGTDLVGLYSPRYGFGFDGILGLRNLPVEGSSLRIHLWPSEHRRAAFGVFSFTDPEKHAFLLTGHLLGEWNRRDRSFDFVDFEKDVWLQYSRNSIVGEVKVGWQDRDLGLSLLPFFRYEKHDVFDGLASAALLEDVPCLTLARDPTLSGSFLGLDVELLRTDDRVSPTRGFVLQGRVERFTERVSDIDCGEAGVCTSESRKGEYAPDFTRIELGAYGYITPIRNHVLAVRFLASQISESFANFLFIHSVDHRMLPGYTRGYFQGDKFLVASTEYRWPVGLVFDLYRIDLTLHGGVLVHRYLSETHMDPGFAVGIRIASMANQRILVNWRIGASPNGFTFTPFRSIFQPDPRRSYPYLR